MNHFNNLTPAEAERLSCLLEEAAEVIQVIGKIHRHGLESYDPTKDDMVTNRELLQQEIGDFLLIVGMMIDSGDLCEAAIKEATDSKATRIGKWLHHQ